MANERSMADVSGPGGTMGALRGLLNETQREIVDGLASFGEMASVFECGAILRRCDGFPARGYMVAHAMREIVNRLPDHYEGLERADAAEGADRLRREDKQVLFAEWRAAVGDLLVGGEQSRPDAERDLTIRLDLGMRLDRWITQEANVDRERVKALAEVLGHLQGVFPEQMTIVAKGLSDLDGAKLAHVPARGKPRDESEALVEWDRFEQILHAILGHRHDAQKRMDDNLAEIESW